MENVLVECFKEKQQGNNLIILQSPSTTESARGGTSGSVEEEFHGNIRLTDYSRTYKILKN
jgi:hypothetical protein